MTAPLEREKGVLSAEADYEAASARIGFDPASTTVEKLIATIGKLGYTAQLKEPQS